MHGDEVDTSLLLYIAPELVNMDLAQDYMMSRDELRRYRRGWLRVPRQVPARSAGPRSPRPKRAARCTSGSTPGSGTASSWPRRPKREPTRPARVDYPTMRLRSAARFSPWPLGAYLVGRGPEPGRRRGHLRRHEGGRAGSPRASGSSGRDGGLITATGQPESGTQARRRRSRPTRLGTPVQYELQVTKQGALAVRVRGCERAPGGSRRSRRPRAATSRCANTRWSPGTV